MDIVGTPRGTAFTVVGIAAAVMVPAQESSVEVGMSAIHVGGAAFKILEAALAHGWVLRFPPVPAAATEDNASCGEQPIPSLRPIPTPPDRQCSRPAGPLRPDSARARGALPPRRRGNQPRDRLTAVHLAQDRQRPRVTNPDQAGRQHTHRGGRLGPRRRPRPTRGHRSPRGWVSHSAGFAIRRRSHVTPGGLVRCRARASRRPTGRRGRSR